MSTTAIDVATIFYAFNKLEKKHLGKNRVWRPAVPSEQQQVLIELYNRFRPELDGLEYLVALASGDYEELNTFLTAHGFDPMFGEPLEGFGVVSILDMLVTWIRAKEVSPSTISDYSGNQYAGFSIPVLGRSIFKIEGLKRPVVRLDTATGDHVWLTMFNEALGSPVDMISLAFNTLGAINKDVSDEYSRVEIPHVSFDIKPSLSFLEGIATKSETGALWEIETAKQQFRLGMDKEGAHAEVATGVGMVMSMSADPSVVPPPLVINEPFFAWFTQKKVPQLPIAIFFADVDSWEPEED